MVVSWMLDAVKSPRRKIKLFFYKQLTFNVHVGCLEKGSKQNLPNGGFMVICHFMVG